MDEKSPPKLDWERYLREMREELERTLREVADAVDHAPAGRVIRDSEHRARDALERFRERAYEKAIQLKIDAAEAAFPPSGQRGDGQAKAS
jgi:primosomal protein N''